MVVRIQTTSGTCTAKKTVFVYSIIHRQHNNNNVEYLLRGIFTSDLFNDTLSNTDCIATNCRIAVPCIYS